MQIRLYREATTTPGIGGPFKRPLHDSGMFGGSFNLAILSGPLALHRARRF